MEGIRIRPITPDELRPFQSHMARAIGFQMAEDAQIEHLQKIYDFDRTLAGFDDEQIVGTAHSWLFDWTVPGGATVPSAGVTMVSVSATHRRRGILNQLMRRQLTEAQERGEPVAILLASESVIYGRYGYGLSTTVVDFEIDPRVSPLDIRIETRGRLRFVDEPVADKMFPEIYDRWRRSQPGATSRDEDWWAGQSVWRPKINQNTYLVYENERGEPDGYATYAMRQQWEAGLANGALDVNEHVAVTPEAAAALWRHIFGVDLVAKVRAGGRPPDEPLRFMLADPRRMRVTRYADFLWARILDVPRMLSARMYSAPSQMIIRVVDPIFRDVDGTYDLDGGLDGAECVGTTAAPWIELGIADLGAVYQGGTSFTELARVGRVKELRPGALVRADAMFAQRPLPWSNTGF